MEPEQAKIGHDRAKIVLEMDAFPFKGLEISEDWKKLEALEVRSQCSACKRSRKYFCYTCHIPVPEISHFVPKVKLPIKVDIVKHPREMDGKSTAVHAAVLAPDDVRIFTFPNVPDYPPHENVVLIYPNTNAVSVEEVFKKALRSQENEPASKRLCLQNDLIIHRAVFIDSTWNQSRGIFKDPRIKKLPSVVLKSRVSQFWRHQAGSPRWYLSTVEAIHQFILELDEARWAYHREMSSAPLNAIWKEEALTDASKGKSDGIISDKKDVSDENKDCGGNGCRSSNSGDERDQSGHTTVDRGTSLVQENTHGEYCYDGQYDNLLFFFRFMYSKIHTLYDHENLKSYKRRLE